MYERELTILETTPGEERVVVVEVTSPSEPALLELRTQQHVPALGWVTQRRVSLHGHDVRSLQMALMLFEGDRHRTAPAVPELAVDPVVSLNAWRERRAG